MKLIVGFGNPGNMYNFTRHNTGFLALDFYAKIKKIDWEKTDKFDAKYFRVGDTFFIKPQTFYNDVGKSIAAFKNFYKIKNEDIRLVIIRSTKYLDEVYMSEAAVKAAVKPVEVIGPYEPVPFDENGNLVLFEAH